MTDPVDGPTAPADDDGDGGLASADRAVPDVCALCREAGVDPEEILDEMGGAGPFRFRPEEIPQPPEKE